MKIYCAANENQSIKVWFSHRKLSMNLSDGTTGYIFKDSYVFQNYSNEMEFIDVNKSHIGQIEYLKSNLNDKFIFGDKEEIVESLGLNPSSIFFDKHGNIYGFKKGKKIRESVSFSYFCDHFYTVQPPMVPFIENQGFLYGIARRKSLAKFEQNLTKIWVFEVPYEVDLYSPTTMPIIHNNKVLCFLGPTGAHGTYNEGGLLVGLDDNTGELIWQKEFVNALDTTCIDEGILYVGTFEGVYLLNPETGETLNFISSGHSEQTKTCRGRGYAEIVGNLIYYTHEASFTLTIFDKTSLEQVKQYQLPDSIRPSKHLFTHPKTGVMYFYGFQDKIDIGGSYLLELNPADSATQVCFEEKPTISHEFVPTEADANECELVITIDTPSLDDAIRYGEIVTRDLAKQHGDTVAEPQAWEIRYNRYPDKRFNGTIKVIFKGCVAESELINERLAVFEQRFINWMGETNHITGWKNGKSNRQLANLIAVIAGKANELIAKKPITTPQNEQAHAYSQYTLADLLDAVIGQAPPDDSDFYSQLKHVAERTINESTETEFKAIASAYLLMAVYYQNENDVTEKQAAFAKAAEYGSVNGAIELLSEVYFDSLALTTQATIIAMNKQDNEMWSCQEDVDYIFEKMPQQQRDEINKVAQAILNKWQAAKFESFYLY